MKTRQGYVQGYNAQSAVTKDQIIVAAEVAQDRNDVNQLMPIIDEAIRNIAEVGKDAEIGVVLADAGYWNEKAMQKCSPNPPGRTLARD